MARPFDSLAERAFQAADGDPLAALDAALTVTKMKHPSRVYSLTILERRKQRPKRYVVEGAEAPTSARPLPQP